MANLPFRILIETIGGEQKSWAGDGTNGQIVVDDTGMSIGDLVDEIGIMEKCTYLDSPDDVWASLNAGSDDHFTGGATNIYLTVTEGSSNVIFTHKVASDTADRLKRYKFFGSHICNVIGFPENMWIYPETFRFDASGGEDHSIQADVTANKLYVNDSMQFTDYSRITSNIQFQVDDSTNNKSDSLLIWRESGSVVIPLVMGYDATNNKMIISSSATSEASFGTLTVGSLTVSTFTSTGINDNADQPVLTLGNDESATFGGAVSMGSLTSTGIDDNADQTVLTLGSNESARFGGVVICDGDLSVGTPVSSIPENIYLWGDLFVYDGNQISPDLIAYIYSSGVDGNFVLKAGGVTKIKLNANGDSYIGGGDFAVGATSTTGFAPLEVGVDYYNGGYGGWRYKLGLVDDAHAAITYYNEDDDTGMFIGFHGNNNKMYFSEIDDFDGNSGTHRAILDMSNGELWLQGGVSSFTGMHLSTPGFNSDKEFAVNQWSSSFDNYVGKIVASTGDYINQYYESGSKAVTIKSAWPQIELTNIEKDKRAFGVVGELATKEKSADADSELNKFIAVNSIGEGAIWVSNYSGSFENGDYITTCPIEGIGMKQDDDLLHNYTVAKITQDCTFDLNASESYNCVEFEWSGSTYRKAFVGCTYHCG